MAGCVEGVRRTLVLGLVLIAGTAIEQAPSVCPLIVLLHQAIPDMKAGDQTSTHRASMFGLSQIIAIIINTVCGWLMITQNIVITLNSIWTVLSINIATKDRTMPSPQLMSQSKTITDVYQPSDYLYSYIYIVLTYHANYIIITIEKTFTFILWCSVLDFMLYEIIHV